jgi:hypothetical protein
MIFDAIPDYRVETSLGVEGTVCQTSGFHFETEPGASNLNFNPLSQAVVAGWQMTAIETVSWNSKKNQRFNHLSREEAFRDLSIAELAELNYLGRLRRTALNPRSADEILRQRRQQQLTQQLTQAIERYVDFIQGPNCSKE